MVFRALFVALVVALAGSLTTCVSAARLSAEHGALQKDSSTATETSGANLCDKWLLVRYESEMAYNSNVPELLGEHREGAFKLTSWDKVVLLEKSSGDCTQKYIAQCAKGTMDIVKTCNGKQPWFPLTSHYLTGILRVRKTLVDISQVLTFHAGEPTLKMNGGGNVSWEVIEPRSTLPLTSISDRQKGSGTQWEADPGCYCCKHSYVNLGLDPFSMAASHKAFYNDECMLASTSADNFDLEQLVPNHQLVSLMSLPMTPTAICSLTCAFRSDKHSRNKYAYMKDIRSHPARIPSVLRFKTPGSIDCLHSGGSGKALQIGHSVWNDGECASFEAEGLALKSRENPGQCLDVFFGRHLGLWKCHGRGNQEFLRTGNVWCSKTAERICVNLFLLPEGASCTSDAECGSGLCEGGSGVWRCANKGDFASPIS